MISTSAIAGSSPACDYVNRDINLSRPDFYLITCEHGGNRIPSRYRDFFRGREEVLRTHRGYDPGALRMAHDMARTLGAPLVATTVSRLLIDLNRSIGHPHVYSEMTRAAEPELREEIARRYYQPYRTKAESRIRQAIEGGARVVHVSCHSFTPEMNGEVRNADIGLLYDPARVGEAELCRRWRQEMRDTLAEMKVRMNYPYSGTADGFTVHLRRRFAAGSYVGIELEMNQKHVFERGRHWRDLRAGVIGAFVRALGL
ncbi:N-formylglutamate amidohydrolase [Herbaspirillum sp. GCM10030257]|uniref:N-formylglutamate amidohydrolase n=1 Tax=Herbaspirillum sp. GCM10030257 TaxID=3273393 RepID=UPI00360D31CA